MWSSKWSCQPPNWATGQSGENWWRDELRTSPLLQHPHPGCDLARPGGHGADRNLNFRMSVQAGCCEGTSAGDYPINPVEWSPVTRPACPGKWGSDIPTKMKTITSLLIINTLQYRAHSSLCAGFAPTFLKSNFTSTQQGALQLVTYGRDSSDTDMRAAMLSSPGGSWVLGSHCWHAGLATTQPTNLRALSLSTSLSRVSRLHVWRNIPRHQYQSIINLHCGCLYGVIYQVRRLNIFTVILLDKCCKYFLKKGP